MYPLGGSQVSWWLATDMVRVASGVVCVDIALRYQIEPVLFFPAACSFPLLSHFAETNDPDDARTVVPLDLPGLVPLTLSV